MKRMLSPLSNRGIAQALSTDFHGDTSCRRGNLRSVILKNQAVPRDPFWGAFGANADEITSVREFPAWETD